MSTSLPGSAADVPMRSLLAFRIHTLSRLMNRGLAQALAAELGLSIRQWRVLLYLASFGEAALQVIADSTDLDKSQASRAVAELAGRGLLSQRADPCDGRRVLVALTEAGATLQRRGQALSQGRERYMTADLDAAQVAALYRLLDDLTAKARDYAAGTGGAPAAGASARDGAP